MVITGLYSGGYDSRSAKITNHLHLVLRLRRVELYLYPPSLFLLVIHESVYLLLHYLVKRNTRSIIMSISEGCNYTNKQWAFIVIKLLIIAMNKQTT